MSAPARPAAPEASGDQDGIPVRFTAQVPDSYVPLPDSPSPEEWSETLDRLLPTVGGEGRTYAMDNMPRLLPMLQVEEVCKTAVHISVENGSLALGMLVVGLLPTRHESALICAESIYRAKKEEYFREVPESELAEIDERLAKGLRGPEDTLLATKLPVGPGVTSVSLRSMTFPRPPGIGQGPPPKLGVSFVQLAVPAPRDYTVYFTISTPTVHHTSVFANHLARIARTVSFDEDTVAKARKGGDVVLTREPLGGRG
ncbi:hypothetical protein FH609_027185 [Streptomyces sp. 3MP-14]|uniref:Uncharacterized protein n=1 Tax=Streptomyces mimosae TaxID=2586635 RepID=A0A5N5ZXZ5_9ACTN|nr:MULTISPECIES: hypothetical protein [Streptomyces]KAB8161387.1 hypothetical protein FH607_025210 [Streptomyces mimosae]KAB8173289.1 hypothetical protein FH609_027185 [Streptomyces sp. 3MP-14]